MEMMYIGLSFILELELIRIEIRLSWIYFYNEN